MKIAHVTDLYGSEALPQGLPPGVGTSAPLYAGEFVREGARALAEHCDDVQVMLLAPMPYWFSLRHPLKAWREYRSLAIVERTGPVRELFSFWLARGVMNRPGGQKAAIRRQAQALAELIAGARVPDIVHAHFAFTCGCAAARVSRLRKVPLVISVRESYLPDRVRRSALRAEFEGAVSVASRVVVASSFQKKRVLDAAPGAERKIRVIPNGVDLERFKPAGDKVAGATPRVSFVGNLKEVKDVPLLISAAKRLREQGPGCDLTVAGDGPLRRGLEEMSRQQGVDAKFTGALGREKVAALLAGKTDVLVVPSRTETFGNVVLEALACGVPVVSTMCGGPEDLITGDRGRLVPVGDVGALAAAVREVWEQREKFGAEKLRAGVSRDYSHAAVSRQLRELYVEVLGERS